MPEPHPIPITASIGEDPAAPPRPRAAVLVVHGMGQQTQFETLARVAGRLAGNTRGVHLRSVNLGGEEFRRAELEVAGTEVHVYEGYWASKTEGNVTLRDVMSFLVRGAAQGVRNATKGITRFSFGKVDPPKRSLGTLVLLLGAALVLGSLVLVNFAAIAVAGALAGAPSWISRPVMEDATWLALIAFELAALLAVLFGIVFESRRLLSILGKKKPGSRLLKAFFPVVWAVFGLLVFAIVALAAGISVLVALDATVPTALSRLVSPPSAPVLLGVWGALLVATFLVRGLFVQYVGDVAAYVSPHKLDRFAEMRKDIKAAVKTVAAAVYEHGNYDRIAIVGHSLGSVVAYDTLNGLLRDDELGIAKRGVAQRTKLLLTFGSPLDKTAFIFASANRTGDTRREALATLSQPLILSARHRPCPWVNVWSKADIVSGRLDLYGDVENVEDPDATTPLVAHNEYWDGELVWRRVLDALVPRSLIVRAEPAPMTAVTVR